MRELPPAFGAETYPGKPLECKSEMKTSRKTKNRAHSARRVLCLGNELMADDALGPLIAKQFDGKEGNAVLYIADAGFRLMDFILNVSDLLVIDTIQTGRAKPGTILVFREKDLVAASGPSSHFIGLLEILKLGRKLRLPIPKKVLVVAVEAADISTIGGNLHPKVQAVLPIVVDLVRSFLRSSLELRRARHRISKRSRENV